MPGHTAVQIRTMRVLVVDDEATIRDVIADALREPGYEVQTASNGVEALTLMHRWLPDIVVLDLMMPRLDGTGFTELLRVNPEFAQLPVLLVTAAYGAEAAAKQAGVRAWLSKPFELDHLVQMVDQLAGQPPQLPRMDSKPQVRLDGQPSEA